MSVIDRFYKIHSENTIVITVSVVRLVYIFILFIMCMGDHYDP